MTRDEAIRKFDPFERLVIRDNQALESLRRIRARARERTSLPERFRVKCARAAHVGNEALLGAVNRHRR
jgi:hypothetical protein